jgi:hypothetical protein
MKENDNTEESYLFTMDKLHRARKAGKITTVEFILGATAAASLPGAPQPQKPKRGRVPKGGMP